MNFDGRLGGRLEQEKLSLAGYLRYADESYTKYYRDSLLAQGHTVEQSVRLAAEAVRNLKVNGFFDKLKDYYWTHQTALAAAQGGEGVAAAAGVPAGASGGGQRGVGASHREKVGYRRSGLESGLPARHAGVPQGAADAADDANVTEDGYLARRFGGRKDAARFGAESFKGGAPVENSLQRENMGSQVFDRSGADVAHDTSAGVSAGVRFATFAANRADPPWEGHGSSTLRGLGFCRPRSADSPIGAICAPRAAPGASP